MISLVINGEPVSQSRPRVTRYGVYFPARVVAYKKKLRDEMQKAMEGKELPVGALKVELDIYRPIPKSMPKKRKLEAISGILRPTTKPDVDNYAKLIIDAGLNVLYKDDSQIVSLHAEKYYSVNPRIEMRVR